MSDQQANEAEKNIEIWKVKKLIKRLEAARGNGTSMISLIIRKQRFPRLIPPRLTVTFSTQRSGITSGKDVGGRIRRFAPLCSREELPLTIFFREPPPTSNLVSIVNPSFLRLHPPSRDSSCIIKSPPMAWSFTVVKS